MNEQLAFEWHETEKNQLSRGMKSKSPTLSLTLEEIIKIYFWGVSYGQAIMEEERRSEEFLDTGICYQSSRKYNIPSTPARRRQVHSEKWFEAMMNDKNNFLDFLAQKAKEVEK